MYAVKNIESNRSGGIVVDDELKNIRIEIKEILKSILMNILNLEMAREDIREDTNLFDLGIDSMTVIDLILAIEDEFAVTLDEEELTETLFERFESLVNMIFKKKTTEVAG